MKPPSSRAAGRLRTAFVFASSALMLGSLVVAGTAHASPSDIDCSVLSSPDHFVESDGEGVEFSAECDRPVEVDGLRSPTTKVTAKPDGSLTAELYVQPQWTQEEAGEWVDIDPSLVLDGDTGVVPRATIGDMVLSAGGEGTPLVTYGDGAGGEMQLWWPEPLPEPELVDSSARYVNVTDDIDLVVTVEATGFSYKLEVHTPEAAAALDTFAVQLAGTTSVDQDGGTGVVTVTNPDTDTVVLASSGAMMWDSSQAVSNDAGPSAMSAAASEEDAAVDPGKIVGLDVELNNDLLTVVADDEFLADANTEYPVTIDPAFTAPEWAWATVGSGQYANDTWWDDNEFPREGGMRVGFNGWVAEGQTGHGIWRSMVRFDLRPILRSRVDEARVNLNVSHTGGCGEYPLHLWQTQYIAKHAVPTSWNSTSGRWMHEAPLDTQTVPSANSAGGCPESHPDQEVTFESEDLTHHVSRHVNQPHDSITFGLRADDETDLQQWWRTDAGAMKLEVDYRPHMGAPSQLAVNDIGCLAPEGARYSGSKPTFSAMPFSSDNIVDVQIVVREIGTDDAIIDYRTAEPVTAGETWSWEGPNELPEGTYEWRVQSHSPDDSARSRVTSWCSFTVDHSLDDVIEDEWGALTCPHNPEEVAEGLSSFSEGGALFLAEACQAQVEVRNERDFDSQVMADPDGTLVAEVSTVPAWAVGSDGEWAEIDTDFTTRDDGTVITAAAVSDIQVSTGGGDAFVTATSPDGGSVSLIWPEPLPEPSLDGAKATFADVLDDVDLQVKAGIDGFSYAFVVKTPAAAANPELAQISVGIDVDGLELVADPETGGLNAVDAAGDVAFAAISAYMWDSSIDDGEISDGDGINATDEGGSSPIGPDDGNPGRYAEMPIQFDGNTVTVETDQTILTDPDAEYPIVIDPPFVGSRLHWATVLQSAAGRGWTDDNSWPRRGGMRVGNLTWAGCAPDACGLWRSMVRFNTSGIRGKDIVSAQVKATQTHTGGCGTYGLQLWQVNAFTSGTSWNGMSGKWMHGSPLQTQQVASSNSSCGHPNRGVTYSSNAVRNRVQNHANQNHRTISFGFRSSSETNASQWRRLSTASLRLEVEYNSPAQVPRLLRTNGAACVTSAAAAPWSSEPRPTLSGQPRDPDGRVGARIEVRQRGSTSNLRTWSTPSQVSHDSRVTWRIPAAQSLSGGEYRWRMRSIDNHSNGTNSAWSNWCHFKVDVTAPTPPKIEQIEPSGQPTAGDTVKLRLTSTDAHSGVKGFHYGIGEEVQREFVSSSGEAIIEFEAPAGGGFEWVYIWAEDHAGNTSNRVVYDFFAARLVEATPAGAWRLDGDGLDDSGAGNELTAGRAGEWVDSGQSTPPGQAMSFDGSDCVATAGSAVRTDMPYTVAAWAKVDESVGRYQTVVAQAGNFRRAFDLRYAYPHGTWQVMLPWQDQANPEGFVNLRANDPIQYGQWYHLAMTVDPAIQVMSLWVDGEHQGDRNFDIETWNGAGPVTVGCGKVESGHRGSNRLIGGVQHVGIWQGLLTDAQIQDVMGGNLPAGKAGEWLMRGTGEDSTLHSNPLVTPENTQWVDDQWGRRASALESDPAGCLATEARTLDTDRSFSVSAWAHIDEIRTDDEQVVVAEQIGPRSKFKLRLDPNGRWGFQMVSHEGPLDEVDWFNAHAPAEYTTLGTWTHLVGVYDALAGEMHLYVNGELAGSRYDADGIEQVAGNGSVLIGCRGERTDGSIEGPLHGAVSDVAVWRGPLGPKQAAEVYGGNPAAEQQANWSLSGNTNDAHGSFPLDLHGDETTDFDWVTDRIGFPRNALGLSGGYAATDGPVVATDESFTIAAWAKLDDINGVQTVLSQDAENMFGFQLDHSEEADAWRFQMLGADSISSSWHRVDSETNPEVGVWYHLAVVYDVAASEMRLYVDGQLENTADGPSSPWRSNGKVLIGAVYREHTTPIQRLRGAIDTAQMWTSTVDPDRIADMARTRPDW
ncbi:LamG domain-containing protein [Natronoglycomyces albus]|uniref:LamG domain-containing protein n=1 Tax=Natronoglycomyces albus TaxID=2811108 RepID=A0A895XIA9_9ACTN|nr:LamG-like jellyroll fold domain-containing protein [Natronoglycomyces albus]QSB05074.1 LamG domain-containing protein [Natronoglycomyces albus]